MSKTPRRPTDPMAAAEAAFKPARKLAPAAPILQRVPAPRELVSIRIDRDVLDYFQEDGPGWQERINAALREAAGLSGLSEEGKRPEELNATNDD
ncbi:BrnA antitoxin family protein [Allomesorhizobium camelthorni]|uniref:BrnA antitoxin family protein n=1 Tax=Allomesorhizobium camelthorni TaxID=475069 RepID=A0A6G4WG33_9HYPH|nr:BrnA antitoxin family protein [Mesorhizobium camelthorni]NGO53559.1 hypothetical protein [Mesorhizobium camelthorni]